MDTINKIIINDNDGKSIIFVMNPTLTQEGYIFYFVQIILLVLNLLIILEKNIIFNYLIMK